MGQSAKMHKRVKKKSTSQPQPQASTKAAPAPNPQVKRKNNLKTKVRAMQEESKIGHGRVLGGVDYVTLMMGGRRAAQGEASKMDQDGPA